MKKVVKVLLFILCVLLGIFIYTAIKTNEINIENNKLAEQINKLTDENDEIIESNLNYENEINKLKDDQKDKIEELAIWKKAKEKLEKALSS